MSISGVSAGGCTASMTASSGVRSAPVATTSVPTQQPSIVPNLGNTVDISV